MQRALNPSTVGSGPHGRYDGAVYDPAHDDKRLDKQLGRVWNAMSGGQWRTLREIAELTGDPESSVSAQLRHLRKPRFGSYIVNRRARGDREGGIFEYRVVPAEANGQLRLV